MNRRRRANERAWKAEKKERVARLFTGAAGRGLDLLDFGDVEGADLLGEVGEASVGVAVDKGGLGEVVGLVTDHVGLVHPEDVVAASGGPGGVVARANKALLLSTPEGEAKGELEGGPGIVDGLGDLEDGSGATSVVIGTGSTAIGIVEDGIPVIEVGAEDDDGVGVDDSPLLGNDVGAVVVLELVRGGVEAVGVEDCDSPLTGTDGLRGLGLPGVESRGGALAAEVLGKEAEVDLVDGRDKVVHALPDLQVLPEVAYIGFLGLGHGENPGLGKGGVLGVKGKGGDTHELEELALS